MSLQFWEWPSLWLPGRERLMQRPSLSDRSVLLSCWSQVRIPTRNPVPDPRPVPCTQTSLPQGGVLLLVSTFQSLPNILGPLGDVAECEVLAIRAWKACGCRQSTWEGIPGLIACSLLWGKGVPVH